MQILCCHFWLVVPQTKALSDRWLPCKGSSHTMAAEMRQTFGTTNSLSEASRSRVSPEADLALRRDALDRSSCKRISRSCWHLRHSCSRMSPPLTAGLVRTAGRGGWGQERSSKPDQQTLHWANRSCQRSSFTAGSAVLAF